MATPDGTDEAKQAALEQLVRTCPGQGSLGKCTIIEALTSQGASEAGDDQLSSEKSGT